MINRRGNRPNLRSVEENVNPRSEKVRKVSDIPFSALPSGVRLRVRQKHL